MVKYILSFFNIEKRAAKIETSIDRLDSKVSRVRKAALDTASRVEARAIAAERAATRLQQETKTLLNSLDEYRITVARLEETLEATREELRTAKMITIPGLVEANQTMLARWEAETQIHVARAALVRTKEE